MANSRGSLKTLFWLALLNAALLLSLACNNRHAAPTEDSASGLDPVSHGPQLAPAQVAHGVEKLTKYVKYPFEVPPHAITPRLTGQFSSFVQGIGGARISDESADVELLVMTEEQYDAFEHKRGAESVYAIEPSHDHEVSVSLPSTHESAVRYYAVFRRSNDGKTPIWVKADLNAEFGAL